MKNLYENWRYGFYYDELERKLEGKTPRRFLFVRFAFDELITTFRYRIYGNLACRWFGHGKHYHCDDWGGSESGGMAGWCDRCGFNFSHTLY